MSSLETLLSSTYAADIKGKLPAAIAALQTAIQGDSSLAADAQQRLQELNALVGARGVGACAFSTKYRGYLTEALST